MFAGWKFKSWETRTGPKIDGNFYTKFNLIPYLNLKVSSSGKNYRIPNILSEKKEIKIIERICKIKFKITKKNLENPSKSNFI